MTATPGGLRIPPHQFLDELFCVNTKSSISKKKCSRDESSASASVRLGDGVTKRRKREHTHRNLRVRGQFTPYPKKNQQLNTYFIIGAEKYGQFLFHCSVKWVNL